MCIFKFAILTTTGCLPASMMSSDSRYYKYILNTQFFILWFWSLLILLTFTFSSCTFLSVMNVMVVSIISIFLSRYILPKKKERIKLCHAITFDFFPYILFFYYSQNFSETQLFSGFFTRIEKEAKKSLTWKNVTYKVHSVESVFHICIH